MAYDKLVKLALCLRVRRLNLVVDCFALMLSNIGLEESVFFTYPILILRVKEKDTVSLR